VASTRDAQRTPHIHWLSGWRLEGDRETMLCLVSSGFTRSLLESVQENGRFAVVVEWIGPHECYQFKGPYLDSRSPTASDGVIAEACAKRFATALTALYGPRYSERQLRGRFREPALAVRFRVDEVFLQTPGPGAGRRVVPEEV